MQYVVLSGQLESSDFGYISFSKEEEIPADLSEWNRICTINWVLSSICHLIGQQFSPVESAYWFIFY